MFNWYIWQVPLGGGAGAECDLHHQMFCFTALVPMLRRGRSVLYYACTVYTPNVASVQYVCASHGVS